MELEELLRIGGSGTRGYLAGPPHLALGLATTHKASMNIPNQLYPVELDEAGNGRPGGPVVIAIPGSDPRLGRLSEAGRALRFFDRAGYPLLVEKHPLGRSKMKWAS